MINDLLEHASDAVFVHELKADGRPGRFLAVNRAACERLGYTRAELLTLSPASIDARHADAALSAETRELAERGQLVFETLHRGKTGIEIPVEISARQFTAAGQTMIIAIARDLRPRRQAFAATMTAARRAATVGRLAGMVAHEVNNPLAAIRTWLALLKQDTASLPGMDEKFDLLIGQVERIARTMKELLGFARQRAQRDENPAPLVDVVRTIGALFAAGLRARGRALDLMLPAALPAVACPADAIQEILANLLENEREVRGITRVTVSGAAVAGGVALTVEDDGPGLGPDPERVFTIYYSNREAGTGLGLAIARQTCAEHGGTLFAANRPERGARFTVFLPVAAAESAPAAAGSA